MLCVCFRKYFVHFGGDFRFVLCRNRTSPCSSSPSIHSHPYLPHNNSVELGKRPKVKTAAYLFKEMCYSNKDRLSAGIICGGWDPKDGGSVYSITLGGTCVKQPYALGGSGSTFIYGYCDANFTENMSRDDCIKFVSTGSCRFFNVDFLGRICVWFDCVCIPSCPSRVLLLPLA